MRRSTLSVARGATAAVTAGVGGVCLYRSRLAETAPAPGSSSSPGRSSSPDLLLLPALGPKAADAVLAGLGLAAGCSVLGLLQPIVGVPLFAPPMMASGVIFFYGPEPPSPKGFLGGTLCSATLSLGTLAAFSRIAPPVVAQGAAAGTLLIWYKATSAVFPPAAVLAGALTAASANGAASGAAKVCMRSALHYLAFPWLAGHAFLYGVAHVMSSVRAAARVAMTTRQLASLQAHTDERLLEIFTSFDTSGDGALDADELKVALRVALGLDLSRDDCVQLVAAADKDGTGTVDYCEFKAVCRGQLL